MCLEIRSNHKLINNYFMNTWQIFNSSFIDFQTQAKKACIYLINTLIPRVLYHSFQFLSCNIIYPYLLKYQWSWKYKNVAYRNPETIQSIRTLIGVLRHYYKFNNTLISFQSNSFHLLKTLIITYFLAKKHIWYSSPLHLFKILVSDNM